MTSNAPPERAPEGSLCHRHTERPAFVRCGVCHKSVCVMCWHPDLGLCQSCVLRDPEAAGPALPWERTELGWWSRLLGTLASSFEPSKTAPAFVRASVGAAFRFCLLVAVPLALLQGVIPFTEHLRFGPRFRVAVLHKVSAVSYALDIAQAAGFSLGLNVIKWLALTLPFLSLTRAYGLQDRGHVALRLMLYRAFLLPLGALVLFVAAWALPEAPPESVLVVLQLLSLLPLLLLLSSMRITSRLGCDVGPLMSLLVVLIPFALLVVTEMLLPQVFPLPRTFGDRSGG